MINLKPMLNQINKLLLENAFNDLYNDFQINDVIELFTINGGMEKYYFRGTYEMFGHKVIVLSDKESSDGNAWLLKLDSYDKGNEIELYRFDFKTKKIVGNRKRKITRIGVIMKKYGGIIKNIDDIIKYDKPNHSDTDTNADNKESEPTDDSTKNGNPEDVEESILNRFYDIKTDIAKFKVGDSVAIYILVPNKDENSDEVGDENYESKSELFFEIIDIKDNLVYMVYSMGNMDNITFYDEKLKHKKILFNINQSLDIENYNITLKLLVNNKLLLIENIWDITINKTINGTPTMSSLKFNDDLNSDKDLRNLYRSKENIFTRLLGLSPLGIYQLRKQLQKSYIKNSYFTKGKTVSFSLKTDNIRLFNSEILEANREVPYKAKIISSTLFRYSGSSDKTHVDIKLIKEREDGLYDVDVILYLNLNKIYKTIRSVIEIINITNA